MRTVRARPSHCGAGAATPARSGDATEAFHHFYVANRARLVWFFARRTLDPEVALDLAADTFAVALQHRSRFRGHTAEEAEAWLFAIARSQLSRHWRRGSAERRALALVGPDRTSPGQAELERIEELSALRELRRDVRTAVARLSPDQAYAVQQRIVVERGYDDLAAELGVSEDVVRARVSRGLRALAAGTAAARHAA
jgi:RNA polymerase sigma-70 factor (ECF subfamily)